MLKFDLVWTHIAAVALVNFFIGFAWYSFLFVKPWVAALKITPEDMRSPEAKRRMPMLMGAAALTALLLSFGSQVLVNSLGASDALSGALIGLFVAVVFIAAHASGSLFERRPLVVYGISVLHGIAVLTLDCAIHAAWR
ncbi:MAG TPA: DUF1761 domain-containing protein [bacterium]|jgi:hypothetical protein|nr:DUF1761 domain-containing protein [bacterium]